MMLSEMIAVILALFVFSTAVEADTEEDVELLIFDRNTSNKLTRSDVFKVINKANLTGHGYKEEVSYQTVLSPESTSYFKESYFYYKVENCSRIPEIEEELETFIPGVFGNDVANRIKTEMQYWHLDDMDQCKVGLEVVFTGIGTVQRSKRDLVDKVKKWGMKIKKNLPSVEFDAKGAALGALKEGAEGAVAGAIAGGMSGGPAGALLGAKAGGVAGAVIGAVKGGVKVKWGSRRRSSSSSRRRSSSSSSSGGGGGGGGFWRR